MKKAKIILTVMLSVFLVLGLVACQTPTTTTSTTTAETTTAETTAETTEPVSTDPVDTITMDNFAYSFTAEGYGEFVFYFNFYEEDPVIGAVFFAGFSNNRINFTGTYTVEETPYDYACFPDRESSVDDQIEATEGTAPYTVTFFDWDGNEIGQCGYDGDILYNDMNEDEIIYAQGGAPVYYARDTEDKFASSYEGELPVRFLEFVADEEVTSTLMLGHNMTYVDLVGPMIEGNWSASETADGGLDIVLTPFDSTDTGATVSVTADKAKCVYTPEGGDPVAMTNVMLTGPELSYYFEGETTVEKYGVDAVVTLNVYDDETCTVTVNISGNVVELDTGTWVRDGYDFVFDFTSAEDATTTIDSETHDMSVPFVIADSQVGAIDAVVTMVKE